MLIPDAGVNAWDGDIVYDTNVKKYRMIYSIGSHVKIVETTDVYLNWTIKSDLAIAAEGTVFFKINGKRYITLCPTTPHSPILMVYDLNFICNMNIDKFPATASSVGAFPWGFVLPVQNIETTCFYLFMFSVRKWSDLVYSYGDLWIYKAKEVENGCEFTENNKLMF